ncbi:hypothetical protein UFOVP51_71 [uncultured Caudovirales phage]|uniref:Uncharacterized protein n=1 Tax=uncultured Caudovirales phage TaxID=2100421 RepID=A0A6J5KPC4_9CAUD|nr:hypothetical protein UFOVP51_71 [uncultured Caudovirales phage]CAB4240870.1 hypothetical protein UFOVP34_35 [uncultured Caudovirales phage]
MRRYLTYTFPAGNTSDVCALQSTAGAGNLVLNGNLANSTNSQVNFLSKGYSRSISLTSVNNLSAINFTILGSQNGVLLSETLTGPNATTKYGNNIYDFIISITVVGAVNAVSIGTGGAGYFPLIDIDLERSVINYSLSTYKLTAASIPTRIFNTLNNIAQNNTLFINLGFDLFAVKTESADNQYILPVANVIPCYSILIFIDGDNTTIANSIKMNFIQT